MTEQSIHPEQGEMLTNDNRVRPELRTLYEDTDTHPSKRQEESNIEYYGYHKKPLSTPNKEELLFAVGDRGYSVEEIHANISELIDDYISEVDKIIKYNDHNSFRAFQLMLCIKVLLKGEFCDELLAHPKYQEFRKAESALNKFEKENR